MRSIIMTVVGLVQKVAGGRGTQKVLPREVLSQDSETINPEKPHTGPDVDEQNSRYEEIICDLEERITTASLSAREAQVILDGLRRDRRPRLSKAIHALERVNRIIAQNGNGRRTSVVATPRVTIPPPSREIQSSIFSTRQDSSWLKPLIPDQLDAACVNDIIFAFLRPGRATP